MRGFSQKKPPPLVAAQNRTSVFTAAYRAVTRGSGAFALLFAIAVPLAAQTAADRSACETLRKHGDPGARACWDRLSRSTNPAIRAEGLWGLKDYKDALLAFDTAIAAKPKDADLKVRLGLMLSEAPM